MLHPNLSIALIVRNWFCNVWLNLETMLYSTLSDILTIYCFAIVCLFLSILSIYTIVWHYFWWMKMILCTFCRIPRAALAANQIALWYANQIALELENYWNNQNINYHKIWVVIEGCGTFELCVTENHKIFNKFL